MSKGVIRLDAVTDPRNVAELIKRTAQADAMAGEPAQIRWAGSDDDALYVSEYEKARRSGESAHPSGKRERRLMRWLSIVVLGARTQDDVRILTTCEQDPPCKTHREMQVKYAHLLGAPSEPPARPTKPAKEPLALGVHYGQRGTRRP